MSKNQWILSLVIAACISSLASAAQQSIQISDSSGILQHLSKTELKTVEVEAIRKTGLPHGVVKNVLDSLGSGRSITINIPFDPAGNPVAPTPSTQNKKVWEAESKRLQESKKARDTIYRVLSETNPPMLLKETGAVPVPGLGLGRISRPSIPDAVLKASHSVGQIVSEKGEFIGTAWVIENDLVVTNCHVVVAMQDSLTDKVPPNSFRLQFSEGGPSADPTRDFIISDVPYFSAVPGFDVALMHVSPRNKAGDHLPAPLPLAAVGSAPVSTFAVGYGNAQSHSQDQVTENFRTHISQFGSSVKLIGPGRISQVAHEANYDVLFHSAATLWGNSGSALFNEKGEVLGLHFCCNVVEEATSGSACNAPRVTSLLENLAIASVSLAKLVDTVSLHKQDVVDPPSSIPVAVHDLSIPIRDTTAASIYP